MPHTNNNNLHNEELQRLSEINPTEAYHFLRDEPNAILIDVRTDYEWENVGVPDLSAIGKEVFFNPWKILPEMNANPKFQENLETKIPNKDTQLVFICRSGGRSYEAACVAAKMGYQKCINVIGGFEGSTNMQGWKYSNLPWRK